MCPVSFRRLVSMIAGLSGAAVAGDPALGQAGGLHIWGDAFGGTIYQTQGGGPYLDNYPLYGAFVHVSSGYDFSLAVRPTGKVVGWGGGWAFAFFCLPVPSVLGKLRVVKAYAGFDHAIALLDDGRIHGWGSNNFAQNGNPQTCSVCLPLPPTLLDPSTGQQVPVRFHSVSAGEWINIGIIKHIDAVTGKPGALDRTIITWGKNEHNRLRVPPGLQGVKFKQVAAGGHHVLALDLNGNVTAWGYYYYPIPPWDPGAPGTVQIDTHYGPNFFNLNPTNAATPYFVSNYIPGAYGAIAAGHHVDYGFRRDAAGNLTGVVDVFSKSNPNHGATRIPAGNGERWRDISAGYYQGMGIKEFIPGTVNNGKLVGWYNLGDPPSYNTGLAPFPAPPPEEEQVPNTYWGLGPSNSAYVHGSLKGCYANCDGSDKSPALSANDFMCFINEFACASKLPLEDQIVSYVNCDGNTTPPILTSADFTCFSAAYAAGDCPADRTARPVGCAPCCPP